MKKWAYKKLGEVCEIICGQDYKSIQDDNGLFPIYGTGGVMGRASQYRCPANSIIIGRKGNINNPLFVEEPFWNVDTAFGVVPKENILFPKFFYFFCKNYDFTKHDVSVTIPSLRRTDIMKIDVPVPPLSEQSRIVSELDLLQSIIDKQQAQLKELDKLAQAIFYDMFGDPVENEKGWKVKKIGNLCDVYRGGSPRPIEKFLGGTIPWIKIGDATKGDDIYLHQTKEHIIEEGLKKTRYIHSGSLIFANCGVSLGFARIITFNGCIHDGWLAFDNISNEIEKVFFLKSLNFCTQYFRSIAPDGTQPNLNTAIMKSFNQILPPLEIQKSYIEKTEAIEHQKASINQSLAETQKLFDYTMDKYFGE